MNTKEAAEKLAELLREIDHAGITVIVETTSTIYLMRRPPPRDEFEEINDMHGSWKVVI